MSFFNKLEAKKVFFEEELIGIFVAMYRLKNLFVMDL